MVSFGILAKSGPFPDFRLLQLTLVPLGMLAGMGGRFAEVQKQPGGHSCCDPAVAGQLARAAIRSHPMPNRDHGDLIL